MKTLSEVMKENNFVIVVSKDFEKIYVSTADGTYRVEVEDNESDDDKATPEDTAEKIMGVVVKLRAVLEAAQ